MDRFKNYISGGRRSEDTLPPDDDDKDDDQAGDPKPVSNSITAAAGIPDNDAEEGGNSEKERSIVEETAMTNKSFKASLSGGAREEGGNVLKNGRIVRETAGEEKKNGEKACVSVWVPGFDARFPQMNQTRRCWQNYVDHYRCTSRYGDDEPRCEYLKKVFTHLCPGFWVEQFDEMRENGTFPSNLD